MASHEAASTFPFFSHSFIRDGILEGITMHGNEPIMSDWWHEEQRNANRLFVAPSGAGKSFKAKLDTIRSHLWYGQRHRLSREEPLRYQTLIVDVEREYTHVTRLLDGVCLRIAPGTTHFLNPFDVPRRGRSAGSAGLSVAIAAEAWGKEDVLVEKVAQVQALLSIMLTEYPSGTIQTEQGPARLSNREKGLLDQALFACYAQKGITRHPDTHHLPPPLLVDLYDILAEQEETADLAQRLHRFVHGSLAGLFAGQTNVSLETAPVVCFDIHDVPTDMRAMVLFLISSIVWNLSFGSVLPRQFIVDELLTIYQYAEGKQFLESLFQRARKHYLSVVGITQYPKLLLDSTIPTNCATTILMAQELASLPLVRDLFQLSEREIELVRGFGKGEALLFSNDHRFAVRFEASEDEYLYCSSDPADRALR
jgi:type IV secretory pathway VirB4 component